MFSCAGATSFVRTLKYFYTNVYNKFCISINIIFNYILIIYTITI